MDGDAEQNMESAPEGPVNGEDDIIRDDDIYVLDSDEEVDLEDGMEGAEGGVEEEEDDPEDKAAIIFRGHTEKPHADDEPPEVYSVHLDPSPSCSGLVASGGRDDAAYVWVANSGQVLFECTGHKESVTLVSFSHDGQYVASIDVDGLVQVWQCSTKKAVWSYECGSEIMWVQWHQAAHVLLAGSREGEVWMWQVPSQDWSKMKMMQSHGAPSLCGKMLPDGKRACVGYANGVVKLWDLKTGTAVHVWQHSVPPEPETDGGGGSGSEEEEMEREERQEEEEEGPDVAILCVDCSADGKLVMSGCADNTVKVFNVQSGKLISTFNCGGEEEEDNSVEAVSFCPVAGAPYAATATSSGKVDIWDLPTSVARHRLKHSGGVYKLKWVSSSPLLFTSCLDGTLRLWDARTGTCKAELTGHARDGCILDFDVSRDDTCLVSASRDGTARVFDLRSITQS